MEMDPWQPAPIAEISWERARKIFGNAEPPRDVWERQFDYCDVELKQLASTPYQEIEQSELGYYFHDLAYMEPQPELFRYLFPVCLMSWHATLLRNQACWSQDAEFHYGLWNGKIFERMLSPLQRRQVSDFFRDSFLHRLDREPLIVEPNMEADPFGWICRFNSLGLILPCIDFIWEPWWNLSTRGRAIAVLQYCSGLIYFEGENWPFGDNIVHCPGKFGPQIWENDSYIYSAGWLEPNLAFLRRTLSFDYLIQKIEQAAGRLVNDLEGELAKTVLADAVHNRELVESRILDLPRLLEAQEPTDFDGWSV